MKLTRANVSRLTCAVGQKEATFLDDEINGLQLRVREGGSRTWYLRFRSDSGRQFKLKLGDAAIIAPSEARALATQAILKVAGGTNPVAERKAARKAATCAELFGDYLKHAAKTQRPNTLDANTRNLLKYAQPLHREPISAVDRASVRAFITKLGETAGPVTANRVLASLSATWAWALRNGVILSGDNPAAYIDRFAETPRDRVLTMAELRAIWQETEAGAPYHRLVRFLMLTGARRGEAAGMTWFELDNSLWAIPAARMKNKKLHEVPLPPFALAQLPSKLNYNFVFGQESAFSGWSGAKKRLDKAVGFSNWGLHDFRRTFSTEMNSRHLALPHIVEEVLSHSGVRGGVSGVYNVSSYRDDKAAALIAWCDLLKSEGVFD